MRIYEAKRRVRVYSKARFTVFITILMVMAFMIGGFIFNATVSGAVEPALETVLIQPGDTIWAIADVYRPENSDTRAYVKKICNLNDIEPGKIYPGQTIQVPIYDAA